MSTITITEANRGQVIAATTGTITAFRCTAAATPGVYQWGDGLLSICESSGPGIPKQIFTFHAPTYLVCAGATLCNSCNIPFGQLTAVAVPVGGHYELDLA
jgi:hypothetical protein